MTHPRFRKLFLTLLVLAPMLACQTFIPGTPQPAVDKLNEDTVRILRAKEIVDRLNALGMNIVGSSSTELAAYVASEIARWGKLVREANIRIE